MRERYWEIYNDVYTHQHKSRYIDLTVTKLRYIVNTYIKIYEVFL